jgi:hypothetical protein
MWTEVQPNIWRMFGDKVPADTIVTVVRYRGGWMPRVESTAFGYSYSPARNENVPWNRLEKRVHRTVALAMEVAERECASHGWQSRIGHRQNT